MQFAGLRSLVKKPEGSSTAKAAPVDPYAMAIHTTRAHHASASTAEVQSTSQVNATRVDGSTIVAAGVSSSAEQSSHEGRAAHKRERSNDDEREEKADVPLYSRAELETRRTQAVQALQAAMRHMARAWQTHTLSSIEETKHTHKKNKTTTGASHNIGAHSPQSTEVYLPRALQDYLHAHFIAEEGKKESDECRAGPVTSEAEDEQRLLTAIADEVNDTAEAKTTAIPDKAIVSSTHTAATVHDDDKEQHVRDECAGLAELLHTLWFLLISHWISALRGGHKSSHEDDNNSNATQAIRGWCYEVYLLACHAMPVEQKLRCGAAAAVALEAWNAAQRTRRHMLELMAYLMHDYHVLCKASSTRDNRDKDAKTTIVPDSLRSGLITMMVRHVRTARDYGAARQDYADLTLGNANWKLGLFSAGEVHMRRSIARVERNRIAHLLNNEHAVQLLHAVRELMRHAESDLDETERSMFFVS